MAKYKEERTSIRKLDESGWMTMGIALSKDEHALLKRLAGKLNKSMGLLLMSNVDWKALRELDEE